MSSFKSKKYKYLKVFCLILSTFLVGHGCSAFSAQDLSLKPLDIFSSCNQVAVGSDHALVVNEKGDLYAWGSNSNGELGDKTKVNQSMPMRITTIDGVKCVAVSADYSVAIKHDGTVWQWGVDRRSRHKPKFLPSTNFPGPVEVEGVENAVGIVAGGRFVLALNNMGEIYTWGVNNGGQLGRGMISEYEQPGRINSSEKFRYIEAGISSSYAIDEDGSVWVWGSNANQVLGIDRNEIEDVKQRVTSPIKNQSLENIVKVSSPGSYATALRADGKVFSWGFNKDNQLGTEDSKHKSLLPIAIQYDGQAVDISNRSLLDDRGNIWRWGHRYFKAGDFRWKWFWSQSEPTQYYRETGAKNIFVGEVGVLVNENNCLESWGYSQYGLRGDGVKDKQKILFNKGRVDLSIGDGALLCIQKGDK